MATQTPPLDVRNVLNLPAQGVRPEDISIRSLSVSSDKAICLRETGDTKQLSIIDTATGQFVHRLQAATDAGALSPNTKFLAVRVGQALQLQNMEFNKKMKGTKMPAEDSVVFMKWISDSTLGIVTQSSVYHWNAQDESSPEKVFDRHASLGDCRMIIDYAASADFQWLMLVGLSVSGGNTEGRMQLYSMKRGVSQSLPGFAGCFTTMTPPGRSSPATLFCFVQRKPSENFKLQIIEVGGDSNAAGGNFRAGPTDLAFPAGAAADFPVTVHATRKHDLAYVLTKSGTAFIFDIPTGTAVARQQVSPDAPIFTSVPHEASGGVLAVTAKTGRVLLITANESNLVKYVTGQLRNPTLAMQLAGRLGVGGADDLFAQQFNAKLEAGDVEGAAKIAASSPGTVLRNKETIQRVQALPPPPGQQKPIGKYFAVLMQHGKLNEIETVELASVVLAQGRAELLQKWHSEGKISSSEELGDLVSQYDAKLALSMYQGSGQSHAKVIQMYMATGEYDKIVPYARQHNYNPNYESILDNLVHQNPKAAQEVATRLVKSDGGRLIEIDTVIDKFMRYNRLRECTGFLLDVLEGDREKEGYLQTRLLEMNLSGGDPQTADYILSSDSFHHFDRPHIAKLCERAGLIQRAVELYEDVADIKRCIVQTARLPPDFLVNFFGTLTKEDALECIKELMNNRSNEPLVVKIATQYADQLGPEELIKIFEVKESWNALYYFLGGIVNSSEIPAVHYKYIVAAVKLKQWKEVERVCRDSTVYNPEEVKDFLLSAQLPDPRALIHVCDRHGFVGEMTEYLHKHDLLKFIEVYVAKVSSQNAPAVIGKLLDLDADDDFIRRILEQTRNECPVDTLVEEVESRNRLRLLQPWLETKMSEGNTDPSTHNALAKIYVTMNQEPQEFLKTNQFYDSLVVGKFCEKLDPYLAFLAYKRAAGACDEELLDVTNRNGLFKDQSRYLVEKQDMDLWARVLTDENPHRKQLIDQVIGTALPETQDPDHVSTTVKAFMAAQLPAELIGLLEKLVLHGNVFNENRNLQNLLVLTAIKCSNMQDAPAGRVMDYINRLDNFDAKEIAEIALRDNYQLYEEAFAIYKKSEMHDDAMRVLIENIENLVRAQEYAERVDSASVWSQLAEAQLGAVMVKESIDSYVRANDAKNYEQVIQVAENEARFEDLVRYLEMARKQLKERAIDTALVYALAQCKRLGDLEVFITSPNVADIQGIGDRCFEEGLYEAAKILFKNANNNAKLASCLVRLGQFQEAVEAALKANSMRSMCDVNAACVEAKEFRLAQKVGLRVMTSPDHLDELVSVYERNGYFDELISMLETGSSSDQAHQGVFTELGVQYSRHRPDELMEHLKIFWSRVNVSRMMRACEAARLWNEAAYLQIQTEEYDTAAQIMMEHSPSAFNFDRFLEIVAKLRNAELYYVAITFFLNEEPMRLERLLQVLTPKLDHARVVHLVRKSARENLPLILPYLKSVQEQNLSVVNEAVNEIMVEDEDYQGLQESIDAHDNFDHLDLAKRLEKHELLEFRRIAARLYRLNKRYEQAIELSKSDNMYKDAIEAAAASSKTNLCNDLLKFFIAQKDKESFTATLYSCYHLVSPDIALELAWRNRMLDYAMPYMIQYLKDSNNMMTVLDERTKKSEKKSHVGEAAAAEAVAYNMMNPDMAMLANEAYNPYQQPVQQPGYPGGQMPYGQGVAPDVYTMSGAHIPGMGY